MVQRALKSYAPILMLAFCAAQFIALACWLHFKLGGFYYYRGDDVGRLLRIIHWTRYPTFLPVNDWLPLTTYLFGGLMAAIPDPYVAPLLLQSVLTAGILGTLGLITLRLAKNEPWLALATMSAATQVRLFESLSLSIGAEVSLWLFLLLAVWLWLVYLETGKAGYALLSAACLAAASMTRYEAWLYIAAFLPIAALTFRKQRSLRLAFVCFLVSAAYIGFFVYYQESHLVRVSPEHFHGLPLSYRGIRLYFRQPNPGVFRSFTAPLRVWFGLDPWLAMTEAGAIGYILAKRAELRWYVAWWLLSLALFCVESGVFGISTDPGRLLVFFHLLILPALFAVLARFLPNPSSPVLLLAPLVALALLPRALPKLTDSESWTAPGARDSYTIARAVHEEEARSGTDFSRMLVEIRPGPGAAIWDATPLKFAMLDRLDQDRKASYDLSDESLIVSGNPSRFSLPRHDLERYLKGRSIAWIVTWSPGAAASLSGLAQPIATVGGRTLLAYGLPDESIRRCRERIAALSLSARN